MSPNVLTSDSDKTEVLKIGPEHNTQIPYLTMFNVLFLLLNLPHKLLRLNMEYHKDQYWE